MKNLLTALLITLSFTVHALPPCKAITRLKTQCKRTALADGYCKQHSPNSFKCGALTKGNKPCQNAVKEQGQHCHNHK